MDGIENLNHDGMWVLNTFAAQLGIDNWVLLELSRTIISINHFMKK
jgi:hypothetical protein